MPGPARLQTGVVLGAATLVGFVCSVLGHSQGSLVAVCSGMDPGRARGLWVQGILSGVGCVQGKGLYPYTVLAFSLPQRSGLGGRIQQCSGITRGAGDPVRQATWSQACVFPLCPTAEPVCPDDRKQRQPPQKPEACLGPQGSSCLCLGLISALIFAFKHKNPQSKSPPRRAWRQPLSDGPAVA